MKKNALEPGLLPIFSLYFVVRLTVILLSGGVYFVWYGFSLGPELTPYVILFVGDLVFLFVFLSWPWLRHHLGSAYLPIVLVASSTIPIVEARYLSSLFGGGNAAKLWLVFPFLSVPLILIAWQYTFQDVLIYCLGTALFEFGVIRMTGQVSPTGMLSEIEIILARSVFFVLVGYIVSNLVEAQRQQRQELAEAHRKLLRYATALEELAVSQERNRLARELHDTLAHTLSGLAVQLDAIATLWGPNPAKARAMLDRALAATRAGLEETRRALQDLRASPLQDLGLARAIRSLAEGVANRSRLRLELNISEQIGALAPEVEQSYYRVAQEALENVAKHADARWVAVILRQAEGHLTLEVSDDGHGFAAESVASEYQFGLKGMHERAEMISATLDVNSRPEQGTTIRLDREVAA
jgi:signal transduction histidine kinase